MTATSTAIAKEISAKIAAANRAKAPLDAAALLTDALTLVTGSLSGTLAAERDGKIVAAMDADPKLRPTAIGRRIGISRDRANRVIVRARSRKP